MRRAVLLLAVAALGACEMGYVESPRSVGSPPGRDPLADAGAVADPVTPQTPPVTRSGGGFVDGGYSLDGGGPGLPPKSDAAASAPGGPTPPPSPASDASAADGRAQSPDGAAPPMPTPPPGCAVQLRPLSSASLATLVAGSTAVVRAELVGITASAPLRWTWQVTYVDANRPVAVTADPRDEAVIQFPVDSPGQYLINALTMVGNLQCAGTVYAAAANPLQLRNLFLVRAIPPAAARMPVQQQVLEVAGGAPVYDEMRLNPGTMVTVDPREQTGAAAIAAYVRVSDRDSPLVFEGYADATAPFGALLPGGLRYDVLVVPAAPDNSGVGARYAPLWVANQTPDQIKLLPLRLAPGIAVHGHVSEVGGAVAEARVVLRGTSIPSTVSRSATDGGFEVLARAGGFTFIASPPPGSGLPEMVAGPAPELTLTEGAAAPDLDLRWTAMTRSDVNVTVLDLDGRPVRQARVRVEAELAGAGTLLVTRPGSDPIGLPAAGTMRVEAVTGEDGVATLRRLPLADYAVVVAPDPSASAAITSTRLMVGGAGPQTIRLAARVRLAGALAGTGDLGGVRITATDLGTDVAAPPLVTTSAANGSFAFAVSARRRYLIVADPPPGSAFARTFVGVGPVEASDFELRQRLPARLPFRGRVVGDVQRAGVPDTLVKVFCLPGAPGCLDPTIPLGEAVSGGDGSFELGLPDPASR